mmetsp:Transcript_36779/g.71784  ORF Transcript_36779/g.71784 Transcript_36779/m.71784 type:complete len:326 (-) Transcript_36779:27-1004(-)
MHMVPVHPVVHKLPGPPAGGGDDGLATRPSLEHHDTKRLVAGGERHTVCAVEELYEGPAAHAPQEPHGVRHPQLLHAPLQVALHVAVPHDQKLDVMPRRKHQRDRLHEQVRPLLRRQPPDKERHGVQRADAVPRLDGARVDGAEVGGEVDAVVHHAQLVCVDAELQLDLVAQHARHADDAVRHVRHLLLDLADALRLPAVVDVAAPPKLGAVDSHHCGTAHVLALHHRLGREPVVAVAHVELGALELLALAHEPAEAVAHVVALCDKVWIKRNGDAVHMHPVHNLVRELPIPRPRVDVHLVPSPLQPRRELRHVRRHAPHRDRVQ